MDLETDNEVTHRKGDFFNLVTREACMRKVLFQIHMYAGLFCAFHMITFGFSSLHFNHRFSFAAPGKEITSTWERAVNVDSLAADRQFADRVRDHLGLMGWTPPWDFRHDRESGSFSFKIVRNGRDYRVRLPRSGDGQVRVEEMPKGFWNTLASLHVYGAPPNAVLRSLWRPFTEICTWVVLFSAFSGVYFWATRKGEKTIGWILLAGGSGGSLAFMLYIWLIG